MIFKPKLFASPSFKSQYYECVNKKAYIHYEAIVKFLAMNSRSGALQMQIQPNHTFASIILDHYCYICLS